MSRGNRIVLTRIKDQGQLGCIMVRSGQGRGEMKVQLEITKAGHCLYRSGHEIDDARTFGAAWEDVWAKVRENCMARATSIGALMDTMHESVINEIDGATVRLTRL